MDNIAELILLLKYLFLGIVQGFTEPIPISSSGHVVIIRELFGIHISGLSFEIIVNFGSLIGVLIVYRQDIIRLIHSCLRYIIKKDVQVRSDFQFVLLLIIATIPTGIIGLLFEDYISNKLTGIIIVGFTLLITGFALWVIRNLHGKKNDQDITIKDAIIIGLAQSIALIPGISRSGATIVAAMLLGMKQETALRFSFLLYLPVSFGITILSTNDIIRDPSFNSLLIPYIIAWIASIIATFYALKWFMNTMKKGNLKYFSFYCFIVGIFIIIFL